MNEAVFSNSHSSSTLILYCYMLHPMAATSYGTPREGPDVLSLITRVPATLCRPLVLPDLAPKVSA